MRGQLTAQEGATAAHGYRNQIMEASRLKSSDIGRAYAESKKIVPRSLNYYEEKYSQKFFKKPFSKLNATQRNKVWLEIIKSSGRPNVPVTKTAIRLNRLGRGLLVVTIAISVYNIATAENKLKATAKEGTSLSGGAIGGAAGGFVAGLACGPGAFVCVTLGVFIGGVAGALASDAAFDSVW